MKLKSLAPILYSNRDGIQFAIVYDRAKRKDLETGCSIEYAIENYGDREVTHIQAVTNYLVITV